MKMKTFRFVLTFGIITICTAARNPSVCTPFLPGQNDPEKPTLSQFNQFSVRVEANFVNKRYTMDNELYFDYTNNRAAVKSIVGDTCTVMDLANSPQYLALFGYKTDPHKARMFTADYLLRIDQNITQKWINRTSIRGIPCNLWRSCDYWPSRNATMVVDWYFSVPGQVTADGLAQVPIRAHVKGWAIGNRYGNNRSFEHFYEFMDFRTIVTNPNVFLTPDGVLCPNRITDKQLPVPAPAFRYTAEDLDLNGNKIGRFKVWYNYDLNLVRLDSTPVVPGQNPLTNIHDFNTGVAYTIDNFHGNCTVGNISSLWFDARKVDPAHVRIGSSEEFFYFGKLDKTKYSYEGQKITRGILCDVWIIRRYDWPSKSAGKVSTWEWYFAAPGYTTNRSDRPSFGMPVMMEMQSLEYNTHQVFNFYEYDEQRPVISDYDIGPCFNGTERKDFQLLFPGSFRATASSNSDAFKYAVLKAIKTAGQVVSSIRINNIQVDYADNNDIIVTFMLLDRPPPIGDVLNPKPERALDTVASLILKAINSGNFRVRMTAAGSQTVYGRNGSGSASYLLNNWCPRKYLFCRKQGGDFLAKLALTFGLITISTAARNPSVCTQTQFKPGTNEPVKPTLAQFKQFSVRVEANIVNKKFTIDDELYFDYANNRAALKSIVGGARTTAIYNFGKNELLKIDKDKNQCTVMDLANSPTYLALFGYKAGPHTAKMFSADNLLRFDQNITEKWINRTSIRGIPCNLWRSCDYWSSRNATMVVDWYFSVPGRLTTEGLDQVPIRCHVKGSVMGNQNGNNYSFEHFYDFMDFQTMVTNPKVFLTPEGVYCPNRTTTKQLPVPAPAFHFTSEILDLLGNRIGRIKEWYDYNLNLVRFDSTPMVLGPFGQNPLTQIHDFNTGVAYIIDTFRGNCTVANISNLGFDVRNVDPTHIRMRSSKEFFYFDKTKYNYEGQKFARGILCDVWITQRNDWPTKSAGVLSTWEWYFATPGYTADLPDHLSFGMPIMLEMNAPKYYTHAVYNIYAYDEQRPVVWDYDIGQCFNYTFRKDFQLLIPGKFRKSVYPNMDDFKYAVLKSVKDKSSIISSLRVNNIQVDSADNHDILVSFTILDRPPPIGDVVHPKQEPDLITVTAALRKAINNGSLTISLNVGGGQPLMMYAKPNSLMAGTKYITHTHYRQVQGPATVTTSQYSGDATSYEKRFKPFRESVQRSYNLGFVSVDSSWSIQVVPQRYLVFNHRADFLDSSSTTDQICKYTVTEKDLHEHGAMAGLAVGMVVLFCLLGVGLMYVFLKRRVGPDVQVKYDKHEKEDITSDFS